MRLNFGITAAILVLAAPAFAQTIAPKTIAATAPTGKEWQIGFYAALNPDCSGAGDVDARLTKKPQNGSVELEQGLGFSVYLPNSPLYVCNTKQVQGTRVKYTSKDGYIGKDAFEVEVLDPRGGDFVFKYAVTVK
jgi:hypothetical protein